MKIANNELKRFSKQIILKNIGLSGQKKIFASKVLIIGIGGLGCPLALYLANSGVGNMGIVDHDKIELTNLNRQILFTAKDLGKYKVDQARKVIKNISKKIKITSYRKAITKKNINSILKDYDIICDGTDNRNYRRFKKSKIKKINCYQRYYKNFRITQCFDRNDY